MQVFITRYWETAGIIEKDVELTGSADMVKSTDPKDVYSPYFHLPDWHQTRKEAADFADKKRLQKIDSLKKKISKLEAMKF